MISIDVHSDKQSSISAADNLKAQIKLFKRQGHKIVSVITGYGSKTGKHKIKTTILNVLMELKEQKQIKDFIKGEDIDIFNANYQNFQYKNLLSEELKRKTNPGIIVIVL